MTIAVPYKAIFDHVFPKWLLILLVVAVLVGVAFKARGPDLFVGPVMAHSPVVLPNGTSIYVQKYEVTVAEWNACHAAGACTLALRSVGDRSQEVMPATGLSFDDVAQYVNWINTVTGHTYRLATLQEWGFMAAEVLPETPDPIFTDPDLTWASAYVLEPQTNRALRPQGSFDTTSQGIVDLNGSVWEWTRECYAGGAGVQMSPDRCPGFYVGGEHIAVMSYLVRDPARGGCAVGTPPAHRGMRLVSDRAL
jgi:formylglycine-generating enzyme required for sulfatase activity